MIFPAPPDGRCRVRRCAGALPGPVLSPTRPGFSRPTIRQPLAVLFASGFDTFQVDSVVAGGKRDQPSFRVHRPRHPPNLGQNPWGVHPMDNLRRLSDLAFHQRPGIEQLGLSAFPPNPHDDMKQKLIRLSEAYTAALEKQLKQGPGASLLPALTLGRQAVALGLETLDLARIHEQALVALDLSRAKNAFARLAGIFFAEANTAIEATHPVARENQLELSRLMTALGRRTGELAVSSLQLRRGVVRRKAMEVDFARRAQDHRKCLEESLELQKRLRRLTYQVLAAQEDERKKISHELQDEIAQTLLGINIRLLSLKQEARCKSTGLKNSIASTRQLVASSVRSVRQAGHKLCQT